jgi:type IV pilus assembly protein PilE
MVMAMAKQAKHKKQTGFTLIELMIVVAIVAILAVVSLPSYRNHISKGNRREAIAEMMLAAQALERNYSVNNTYAVTLGTIYTTPTQTATRYTISLSVAGTATGYTLQAVPIGSQINDRCGTLTLTSTGAKTFSATTTGTAQECW